MSAVRILSPNHLLPWESFLESRVIEETDAELVAFWETEERAYRETVDLYFPRVVPHLPAYNYAPYETTVVRAGKNGLIVGARPSDATTTMVRPIAEYLDSPTSTWPTLFVIQERMGAKRIWFNFGGGPYPLEEAEAMGARRAFHDALELLWHVQEPGWFDAVARSILVAEGVRFADDSAEDVDLLGDIVLSEPGGYRRVERWGYKLVGPEDASRTEEVIGECSEWLDDPDSGVAGCYVVTAGDHTTIGKAFRIEDRRVRMLDRPALVRAAHAHPHVLDEYFEAYAQALTRAAKDSPPLAKAVASQLRHCPRGHGAFVQFEALGTLAISEVFGSDLAAPRKQKATDDGVRRPDAIYPIRASGPFWDRIRTRFGSDFLVVDFKNYTEPIGGDVVDDVAKYGTDTVGKLVVAVAREGGDETARKRSIRLIHERGIGVLIVSDRDLVAMARLRDEGDPPETVLGELLDDLLTSA